MTLPLGSNTEAWLKPPSINLAENEFLINRGAKFRILDAWHEGIHVHVQMIFIERIARRLGEMSNDDNKISTGGLSNLEFPQELLNRIGLTAQQLIDMSVTPDDLTPMPIEERRASDGADFFTAATSEEAAATVEQCVRVAVVLKSALEF